MNGKLHPRNTSSVTEALESIGIQHLLIFMAGAVVMSLHQVFRFGLELPGRQGLALMAVFVFLRCAGRFGYTGMLAAAGAASSAVLVRGNPEAALIVLAQGFILDSAYSLIEKRHWAPVLIVMAAALAHLIKPLVSIGVLHWAAAPTDSFRFGLAYPLVTHFVFGLVGGIFGFLAWKGLRKKSS